MEAIPLHVLPADQLFRLYVQDGSGTRIVLWFKCGNNGDLVTKPLSSGRHVFEAKGKFDTGTFHATSEPEKISLTGVEKRDHLHLTYHPSIKEPTPVLNGPGCRKNAPRFDLTKLTKLEEVAVHLLASPGRYSVEKTKDQYHGFCRVVNQKPKFSRKGTAPLKLDGFSPLAHKIGRRTTSYPHR